MNALRRFAHALFEERWLIVLVLAALAVRLHWNLVVHPPGEFIYSDMRGYVTRAESIFADPWGKWEYNGFYPFGTHVFLYGVQAIFGRDDYPAIGSAYAVLGAIEVGVAYALARRVTRFKFVAPLLGLVLVAYYPLISLGGYFLSEVPFSFCLVTSTLFLVRLIDTGRRSDAVLAGFFAALGFTLRPQIVLSIGLFALLWLFARKAMPKVRISRLAYAAAPLLLMFAFSSWRLHYHTGRVGLISENGTFNRVFGRCHNEKIVAVPDTKERRRTSFGPPPLIQLNKRAERMPGVWPQLEPAAGIIIEYKGYIGDTEIHRELIKKCIEKTGWKKQVEFSVVHAFMLWRYNILWPDSGKGFWRDYSQKWGMIHANLFAVPALLGLGFLVRARRFPKHAVLAMHLVAILIVAMTYFGDVRLRTPYDPFIILLALEIYAFGGLALVRGLLRVRRSRRNPAPPPGVEPRAPSSDAGKDVL